MQVAVGPVTHDVIADLLPRLRPVDRLELDCMGSDDPDADLRRMIATARRSRATYIDGDLVCIFGVSASTTLGDVGCPWALTTRAVERREFRREFIAGSRVGLEWLGQDFRRLWNLVAEENAAAIRWLRWLGFRFDGRAVDLRGHRFLHFEKEIG